MLGLSMGCPINRCKWLCLKTEKYTQMAISMNMMFSTIKIIFSGKPSVVWLKISTQGTATAATAAPNLCGSALKVPVTCVDHPAFFSWFSHTFF